MPIEIRELHIKVIIDPNNSPNQNANAGGPSTSGNPGSNNNGDSDRDALVAECVEQVMAILQAKNER
ncbi:MAG: hypothetical protein AVDCRST_MAG95-2353 [uncultured Adhaeribacter sp.]|uniref:Uncharacterized protein n=1 Tax=uncultured Adhaeribacter sp. TaxID=448109 RepID=A0A6J4IY63_9BACT|nr:MAG: hypothetical protein AVDCRST_MAG95-2353 [uncultured Adhaeribacter sp.]